MDELFEFLVLIAERLDRVQIPYMLSGSVALSMYAQPRMTRDIDFVVDIEEGQVDKFVELFKEDCYIDRESVLEAVELNRANNLPDDARTRSVLVQGDHEYGKIALAEPMNYEIPNLVPDALAPNIGYLAQSFLVDELAATASDCAELGVEVFTAPVAIDLPGRGRCQAMIVRNPGSGALQEIFQTL